MFDTEKYNQGIKKITEKKPAMLKAAMGSLSVGQTGALLQAIRLNYKYNFGEVDAIGFALTKGGIMTEKGVGKGVPIDSAATNMGKIGRKQKPWFTPILDDTVQEVADYVAEQKADALVKSIQI